jgi:hypothetical protein
LVREGIVNYEKLDADLSAELDQTSNDPDARVPVFIHVTQPVGVAEEEFLRRLGLGGDLQGQELITATLAPRSIEELSSQPWVRYLKMARPMRPLDEVN